MSVTLTFKGEFFKRNNRSLPRKTIQKIIQRVAEEGDDHIADLLRPRPAGVYLNFAEAQKGQYSTGHYASRVRSTPRTGLRVRITDGGVEYGPWLEGTSSRNQSTRFKGYHVFRKTVQWLQRTRVKKIMEREVGRMSKKLNR
jgi:hypothetical protein